MYDLPSRWNSGEIDDVTAFVAGWLIERIGDDLSTRLCGDPPRYLQLGTGQWCPAEYATLFPQQSTALIYAREFGYVPGRDVRLAWHRKR